MGLHLGVISYPAARLNNGCGNIVEMRVARCLILRRSCRQSVCGTHTLAYSDAVYIGCSPTVNSRMLSCGCRLSFLGLCMPGCVGCCKCQQSPATYRGPWHSRASQAPHRQCRNCVGRLAAIDLCLQRRWRPRADQLEPVERGIELLGDQCCLSRLARRTHWPVVQSI